MAELVPGAVLGDRFELHGVVGRGGTAVVWLATDRLRGERVALKVVHAHLAADPAAQRRLRREVQAAAVLRSATCLVPHDLHELDGRLALSMPFHGGRTLAERVSTGGPLPADEVRALGVRIAQALADAHASGVLHRDVTATNVMIDAAGSDAVLTDFGLARLQGGGRSTGLLGTAGYAAPEVYAGERADPRSDLYGLGAVLYLAATGRPAFDPKDPMAALKRQLEESWTPIRELRPDLPADLAATIESLLRKDASARPPGAREVADRLERREPSEPVVARPAVQRVHLPPGPWTVLVKEKEEDRGRREQLRVAQGRARSTTESEIARWGRHLVGQLRDALGIPAAQGPTPEELLASAVAEEAGLAHDALQVPPMLLQRRFRLVEGTDDETAHRLADAARAAGFHAEALPTAVAPWQELLGQWFWLGIVGVWVGVPWLVGLVGDVVIPLAILLTVALAVSGARLGGRARAVRHASAYRNDLTPALVPGRDHAPARYAVSGSAPAPVAAAAAVEATSRGEGLRRRAEVALFALEQTLAASPDLPDAARSDLRDTIRDLRERSVALAEDVDRLESALGEGGASDEEIDGLRSRLDRLRALRRAGERVDATELGRLEQALAQHEADLRAADAVEAELAASTAHLLEIASTASRVRRELLTEPDPHRSADEAVKRLSAEVHAADRARRELGARRGRIEQ